MADLGVLFDIDALGEGLYGYTAYQSFFGVLDPRQIAGATLSDGDTRATLTGTENRFCIAVQSVSEDQVSAVRRIFGASSAKGLAPLASRFVEAYALTQEPLTPVGRIDATGQFTGGSWALKAWQEVRHKYAPR